MTKIFCPRLMDSTYIHVCTITETAKSDGVLWPRLTQSA